jgi:hypothetical protein
MTRKAYALVGLTSLILLGFATATASASPSGAANCSAVGPSTIKSNLGITVQTPSSGNPSSFGRLTYLACGYGSNVTITFITPATGAGYNLLMATLKKATIVKNVAGSGIAAFSGTGSSTSSVFANGKTTTTTVATTNLWVYGGKAIFEISVGKGNLSHEELLAKVMLKEV